MAKKATIGTSPSDSAMDKMDRFIRRNDERKQLNEYKFGKRKHKDTSQAARDLWPLKDQIAWHENRTLADKFDERYQCYSTWLDTIQENIDVHYTYFLDCVAKIKPDLEEMHQKKIWPKEAAKILGSKYKIY